MDIDLVYLWCDGSQPKMLEKRLKAEQELGIVRDESVNGKCRYVSTDELRFSLRSVELHAPWIRRIFIVVDDDQILPEWLKIEGTKITIVRHSEIMPPKMMPIFNSMAISFRIPFIKGLSECFLYANDDMMIFRDVSPECFFTAEGHPIVYHFGARNKDGEKTQYHRLLINCEHAVTEAFGVNEEVSRVIGRWPHHNIQGFCKSHWLECHKLFHKQIETTCHSRFRADDNLEEWLFSCYALAIGEGEARLACNLTDAHGPKFANSLILNDWSRFEELLYIYNPLMFCVNDNGNITDFDRLMMKDRLAKVLDKDFRDEFFKKRMKVLFTSNASVTADNPFVPGIAQALRNKGLVVDGSVASFRMSAGLYDIINIEWPEALFSVSRSQITMQMLDELEAYLVRLKRLGVVLVYTRHNILPHDLKTPEMRRLYSIIEENVDAVFHMGEFSRRELLAKRDKGLLVKDYIIEHHLPLADYRELDKLKARKELGIAADASVVVAFGDFRNEEEIKLTKVAVAGSRTKNVVLLAPRMDNRQNRVDARTLALMLNSTDVVFVQRVSILNSGNLILGMMYGKVVVGPRDGNVEEILQKTGNPGFDPLDFDSAARALDEGFDLARSGKGRENKDYAFAHWHPDVIAGKMVLAYQELLKERGSEVVISQDERKTIFECMEARCSQLLTERQADRAKIAELRSWIADLKMVREKLSTEKAAANKKIEDLRKWIASLVATREKLQKVLENLQ